MCCQTVAKVKAVGICSLMGFYHARHALFPDEYIKIITVQTEFLITDLLAIVLCFLYAPFFSLPCLFICTSEYRIVYAVSFPSTWKWFWKCQSCLLYSVITCLLFDFIISSASGRLLEEAKHLSGACQLPFFFFKLQKCFWPLLQSQWLYIVCWASLKLKRYATCEGGVFGDTS